MLCAHKTIHIYVLYVPCGTRFCHLNIECVCDCIQMHLLLILDRIHLFFVNCRMPSNSLKGKFLKIKNWYHWCSWYKERETSSVFHSNQNEYFEFLGMKIESHTQTWYRFIQTIHIEAMESGVQIHGLCFCHIKLLLISHFCILLLLLLLLHSHFCRSVNHFADIVWNMWPGKFHSSEVRTMK